MKIKCLNDNVIVKRLAKAEKSLGGIVLPFKKPGTDIDDIMWNCEVVATGPGWLDKKGKRVPTGFSPGEKVVVSRNGIIIAVPDEKDTYVCQANAIACKGQIDG